MTPQVRLTLITLSLRRSSLTEALEQLQKLQASKGAQTLPVHLVTDLLLLAAQKKQLVELAPQLQELGIQLNADALDSLLKEASRRKDCAVFSQVIDLTKALGISLPSQESPKQ